VVQFGDELGAPYQGLADNSHPDASQRKASVFEEMSRPNVAQLLGLRVKESSGVAGAEPMGLYVTNTHLFWDPRYRFVRLKQCQTLMDRLASMQAEQQTNYPSIMMGDFNVTPDNIIYHYLTDRSELEKNEEQWSKFLTPAEHGSQ
jgi:mRNA deadenylase 3'-5' endonuclease subunit Ccr4